MRTSSLLILLLAIPLLAGSFSLFSDTMEVGTGTYRFIKFRIIPEQADSTLITGEFSTAPVPTKMEFILLTEVNYRSGWVGRGEIDTLSVMYAESGSLLMEVPGFGDYVLIVSNRGNTDSAIVTADFSVSFRGTGVMYDSLPFGMTLLMIILAVGVVTAAVLLTMKRMSPGKG